MPGPSRPASTVSSLENEPLLPDIPSSSPRAGCEAAIGLWGPRPERQRDWRWVSRARSLRREPSSVIGYCSWKFTVKLKYTATGLPLSVAGVNFHFSTAETAASVRPIGRPLRVLTSVMLPSLSMIV